MKKIKLELNRKSVQQKIADGEAIAPQLSADPNLQVKAAGATLMTATTALNIADTARMTKEADAIAATVALGTQETVYDDAQRTASNKIMEIYPNNVQKWKDAGYQIGEDPGPVGKPAIVENLSVSLGDVSAEADLHWDSLSKVNGYKIQMSEETDPVLRTATVWKPATPDISTKSKMTATGLTPGKYTSFRVAAFNTAGTGPWSNPVGRIIS